MINYQEIITKKIKELIKERFNTQKEFANNFQISERSVSSWMRGKHLPELNFLITLANYCDLHISYFFSEDDNSNSIDQELFNQVFKLAYKFAEANNIEINGSYFLGCYDLVVSTMKKDNLKLEEAFKSCQSLILKFMK